MTTADDFRFVSAELVRHARTDAVTFNDFVLKDERTGTPITACPMHVRWHGLADKHRRVQLISHIDSGKTQQLAIGRVLFELGRNPDLRIVIGCNTASQAAKLTRTIGQYIEHSAALHEVFPHLVPDSAGPWNQSALTVRRSGPSKDPSVQACGVHGNILGSRVDLLVLDDVCDLENTRTVALRDDLDRWLRSTLLGRLTEDSRAWILGNVWHRDDQYARFAQTGWKTLRFPVTDKLGRPRWREHWPPTRISATRKDLLPREAARQLDCVPPDEADPVFPAEWITAALKAGEAAATEHLASAAEPGSVIVLGCDVAYSERRTADESALVLCRASRQSGRREVAQVMAGRWNFDELTSRIVNVCKIHKAIAAIESNAGGAYVVQQAKRHVPTVGLHTSAASRQMRAEMLSSELATGRWSLRQPGFLDQQMRLLAQELLAFSFEEHTGDRAAALFVAVEAIRKREQRPRGGFRRLNLTSR